MVSRKGLRFLPLIIMAVILSTGCQKWRDNREVITASDHMLAESMFHEVSRYVILKASSAGAVVPDTCSSVAVSDTTYPYTITIDFGAGSCESFFYAEFQGQITAAVSGPLQSAGSMISITLNDLFINGYKVEGAINILSKGANNSGNLELDYTVTDGDISLIGSHEGETVSWNCDYDIEVKEIGPQPGYVLDDLYLIGGAANGVNHEGRSFTATIDGVVEKELDCRWNRKGKVKIMPDGLKDRLVDLGGENCSETLGCCDNLASVEIGRKEFSLNMR